MNDSKSDRNVNYDLLDDLGFPRLMNHVKQLIDSESDDTEIHFKSSINDGNISCYLILKNDKENFADCHYFIADNIDRNLNIYAYYYIPMQAVQALAEASTIYNIKKMKPE